MNSAAPVTMPINELATVFRLNDIPVGEMTLSRLIQADKFPFAVGVPGDKAVNKGTKHIIFREGCYEWITQQLHRPAITLEGGLYEI